MEVTLNKDTLHQPEIKDQLSEQVAIDLNSKLNTYNDPKKGIKILSRLMNVHEKTFIRLINKENKPGPQTLLKIYRFLLSTNNDSELLQNAPEIVKDTLLKKFSHLNNNTQQDNKLSFEEEFSENPVFTQIYFYLATGGITREKVNYKFGKYGEEILNKMLLNSIAVCIGKNSLNILGDNQPNFTYEIINKITSSLLKITDKHTRDEIGKYFQTFRFDGLTEAAFNEWIKIDEEAYQKKILIAEDKNNHGKIRTFSYSIVDKIR